MAQADEYRKLPPADDRPTAPSSGKGRGPEAGWKLVRDTGDAAPMESAIRPDLIGLIGWVGVVVTAAMLAGVTWFQARPLYEITGEIRCIPPDSSEPVAYKAFLQELQAPSRTEVGQTARSWTFADLLRLGTPRFDIDPDRSAVRVTIRTGDPQGARRLCEQWVGERLADIGTDLAGDRVSKLLDELAAGRQTGDGTAREYRSAVANLRDLHGQLRDRRGIRREALTELNDLRSQSPPSGVVRAEELGRAIEADTALQQDVRQLRSRAAQIRVLLTEGTSGALEAFSRLTPAVNALEVRVRDLKERRHPGRVGNLVPHVEAFAAQFVAESETIQGALVGTLAALRSPDQRDARALLGIAEQMDAAARRWSERIGAGLRLIAELVDELSEGHEASVRQVLVQNQLRRSLFTLRSGVDVLSEHLVGVRLDSSFRLDALTRTARGLAVRTTMRRRRIEERLQADADADARRARQAELAMLEQELEAVRHIEQELMGRFLIQFESTLSLEDGATDEVIAAEQLALLAEVRGRILDDRRGPLAGYTFSAEPFEVNPNPINSSKRLLYTTAVGASGGVASLVLMLAVGLIRRWVS